MASFNRVFLLGNLTRDPEVRYVPSGAAVASLRLAVNRRYKSASGEERDETCFVDVVVWGKQAEACGNHLAKGSSILLEGRLQYDEWEKDGQKNSRLRVVADRVQFMGAPKKTAGKAEAVSQGEPREDAGAAPAEGAGTNAGAGTGAAAGGEGGDDDNLPF